MKRELFFFFLFKELKQLFRGCFVAGLYCFFLLRNKGLSLFPGYTIAQLIVETWPAVKKSLY